MGNLTSRGDLAHALLTENRSVTALQRSQPNRRGLPGETFLVGVLNGAVMVMADLARALSIHANMDWMAVSSYGSGTTSSSVVQILKDLDGDVEGRDILSLKTFSIPVSPCRAVEEPSVAQAAVVEIFTLLRKPDAVKVDVEPRYVGFDIPNEFVVGYELDYARAGIFGAWGRCPRTCTAADGRRYLRSAQGW